MANEPTNEKAVEEGDGIAQQCLSAADLAMSPEEYAARRAHLWLCFSLDQYCYRDASLGAWVRRLGEILTTEGEVARCRRRFLTADELAAVEKQEREEF